MEGEGAAAREVAGGGEAQPQSPPEADFGRADCRFLPGCLHFRVPERRAAWGAAENAAGALGGIGVGGSGGKD